MKQIISHKQRFQAPARRFRCYFSVFLRNECFVLKIQARPFSANADARPFSKSYGLSSPSTFNLLNYGQSLAQNLQNTQETDGERVRPLSAPEGQGQARRRARDLGVEEIIFLTSK